MAEGKKEKTTAADVERRVSAVYEKVIRGWTRRRILRFSAEEWQLSGRQTDTYIQRVNEEIKKTYGADHRKRLLQGQMAKLDHLYHKNYDRKDYKECRGIIESVNKLFGLNEAVKIEVEQINEIILTDATKNKDT